MRAFGVPVQLHWCKLLSLLCSCRLLQIAGIILNIYCRCISNYSVVKKSFCQSRLIICVVYIHLQRGCLVSGSHAGTFRDPACVAGSRQGSGGLEGGHGSRRQARRSHHTRQKQDKHRRQGRHPQVPL